MRSVVLLATLAAALLPSSVGAQSTPPVPLTEADALARLSPHSPRVRAIRGAVDLARADVLAAGRWPNPRFSLDRESVAGTIEYLMTVAQTLPINGERDLQVKSSSALVEASVHRADDEVRRARADLRLAFARLIAAQAREQELAAAGERLRSVTAVLTRREAAGDAAGFDRLRAEREVLEMDAERGLAASERAQAQADVAAFFAGAGDPSRIVASSTPLAAVRPLPTVDELVRHAETTRGDVLGLKKEAEAAALSAQAADRRWIPEPEIRAGTKSSSVGGGDIGGVIAVQTSIPLFDRGNPERAIAEARARQAEARAAMLHTTRRAEIAGLHAVVLERRQAADRYRTAVADTTGQIERIAQVSYDAGERGILELLDAYRTGALSRLRQASLDAAVREAEIELEFVSGWEMP